MKKFYNAKECYDLGVRAKKLGWMRETPFYEQERASWWWMQGYDGVSFEEAEKVQPDFPCRVVSAKAAREAGLPIPEDVDRVEFHG